MKHDTDYLFINLIIKAADKIESTHPGYSVLMRQTAEYMEQRLVPIEERRS